MDDQVHDLNALNFPASSVIFLNLTSQDLTRSVSVCVCVCLCLYML